jgi:hypothetical protein
MATISGSRIFGVETKKFGSKSQATFYAIYATLFALGIISALANILRSRILLFKTAAK